MCTLGRLRIDSSFQLYASWQETCLPYQQHQFQVSVHLAKLVILYAIDVLGSHQVMFRVSYRGWVGGGGGDPGIPPPLPPPPPPSHNFPPPEILKLSMVIIVLSQVLNNNLPSEAL